MSDTDQCRALTAGGERCTRPAQDDGFCYQHDEDDPTIDDDTTDTTTDDESTAESSTTEDDVSDENDEDVGDDESEASQSDDGTVGLIEVRDTVRSNAGKLIGHPFDALVEVGRQRDDDGEDDGWLAVVEVVERKAVPDTQDILGRYEIDLNDRGEFQSYRRVQRLHRGDTGESEV
ncbi:gas vesicle protein GvpO, halophile-type [Halomarina rubra]|uniref:Gas vesicle protein GvpO, halophile-type n=1 Tax=Halomarina rubra TaxID=2071873 RepID=A0ABD6AZR3_9EURY|nr:gas vesicle protein GvpO [Halomarina rubra]